MGIAFIIATPLSWIAMNHWLQGFAYHTNISPWMFIATGSFTLFIALATISIQVVRAVGANPVKNLSGS